MWCLPATAVEICLIQATELCFSISYSTEITSVSRRRKYQDEVAAFAAIFEKMMKSK
jgi:hypothetical protein